MEPDLVVPKVDLKKVSIHLDLIDSIKVLAAIATCQLRQFLLIELSRKSLWPCWFRWCFGWAIGVVKFGHSARESRRIGIATVA